MFNFAEEPVEEPGEEIVPIVEPATDDDDDDDEFEDDDEDDDDEDEIVIPDEPNA